jgi:SRSO17 transposase
MIAQVRWVDGHFWVFHRQMIDEGLEMLLEKKPDERLWLNVANHYTEEYNFACYRLRKNDMIKVGRVRFKIREIVSPIY